MKMAFHRRSYTTAVNIIAELNPDFKSAGNMLFSALLIKRTLLIIVLSLNFRYCFSDKKGPESEF